MNTIELKNAAQAAEYEANTARCNLSKAQEILERAKASREELTRVCFLCRCIVTERQHEYDVADSKRLEALKALDNNEPQNQ